MLLRDTIHNSLLHHEEKSHNKMIASDLPSFTTCKTALQKQKKKKMQYMLRIKAKMIKLGSTV